MAGPYEWRIDDIERKASAAAPRHELDATRSDVARLEHTVRELCAERDELRAQLQTLQARIEVLETPENA